MHHNEQDTQQEQEALQFKMAKVEGTTGSMLTEDEKLIIIHPIGALVDYYSWTSLNFVINTINT